MVQNRGSFLHDGKGGQFLRRPARPPYSKAALLPAFSRSLPIRARSLFDIYAAFLKPWAKVLSIAKDHKEILLLLPDPSLRFLNQNRPSATLQYTCIHHVKKIRVLEVPNRSSSWQKWPCLSLHQYFQ